MAKVQRRKPPRKPAARAQLDDDLVELATLLDEHRLDKNAAGWFTLPWRDGWNAIRLARIARQQLINVEPCELTKRAYNLIGLGRATAEVYWEAGEIYDALKWTDGTPLMRAALRCLQIKTAASDGGGHIYNDILRPIFETMDPIDIEAIVLTYRSIDAIGTGPNLVGDLNDPLRRAFGIAWKRGLYHAAYSLPQAKDRL